MSETKSIKLKIGKYEYDITEADKFLDNGACVQLLTQSKEKIKRYDSRPPSPKLSLTLIQKIKKMELIQRPVPAHLMSHCRIFSIRIKEDSSET